MRFPLALKLRLKQLLGLTRSRIIGDHVEALLTNGYNGRLLISTEDLSIGRHLAFEGEYNRTSVEQMSALVTSSSRVLIVGTHVGAILVPLAKIAQDVVGIEANPQTYDLLAKNVLLNGLSNVRVLSLAASNKNGTVEFLLSRSNTGGSKINTEATARRREFVYDRPDKVSVKAARLDDVLRGQTFDFILMDIEGSEHVALQGMPELLANAETLVVEVLPNHIEWVAGVTLSEFLLGVPAAFQYARILTDDDRKTLSRRELLAHLERTWNERYFDGCDVLFSKVATPHQPL